MEMMLTARTQDDRAAEGLTVVEAATRVIRRRYRGMRSEDRAKSCLKNVSSFFPADKQLNAVTTEELLAYVECCEEAGNAPSTINIKLSFLSSLFDEFKRDLRNPADSRLPFAAPDIPWRPRRKVLKWWLKPALEADILAWCHERGEFEIANFIEFVTHTGCRIEEALRLTRDHFDFSAGTVTIPGTKTDDAQRTVPLASRAKDIAQHRLHHARGGDAVLFHFTPRRMGPLRRNTAEGEADRSYQNAKQKWHMIRVRFGLTRTSTATLKALRRTFARRANENGMPTEMLRLYLGHSDIATTIDYLRLVGGYTEEMRKYVS